MSDHCQHCTDSCDVYFAISNRLHTSGKSAWLPGECPYCSERAAIVAYLNEDTDALRAEGNGDYRILIRYANAIERGDHVKNTDRSLHDNETCKEGCDDE